MPFISAQPLLDMGVGVNNGDPLTSILLHKGEEIFVLFPN